ncbi:MAG TPA: sulfatase-like hydrolase/transferase [Oscillospiraceae bacterium]|nr:sulfatase-like hydrolase/transferase [Oscillospiraceae bacterium]
MKPNIIFYFSDQQRHDTLNSTVMPNLTAFSNEGTVFENSFTCQPVCGPARACIQTGVYANQNKSYWNGVPLSKEIKPLAEHLNEAGYETAYIGKWHLASDRIPKVGLHYEKKAIPKQLRGGYKDFWRAADVLEFTSNGYGGYVFDENNQKCEFSGYRADCINDFAIEYINNKTSDKPFFLFISQLEPHHQNDSGHFEGKKETIEKFKSYPIPEDLAFLKGDYNEEYPDYISAINAIDENLLRLVNTLKEKNLYDNTVIIYTSDHSCHFKTRNLEYKRSPHDSSIRTPLVIFGGAYKGKKKDDRMASLIDMAPTILDFAGADIPNSYMGSSLIREKERDFAFVQVSESQIGRAVRTKRYLYSIRAKGNGFTRHSATVYYEDYLYDMEKDPYQKENLIKSPDYEQERTVLKEMLIKEMVRAEEKKPIIKPAKTIRKK